MPTDLLLWVAWMISVTGFACLALSQNRHWQTVAPPHPGVPPQAGILRIIGIGAQGVAAALTIALVGPGFGSLLVGLGLTLAAITVALTLTWRPQLLRPLARIATGRLAIRLQSSRSPRD
jgi:hypothetical protein